MATFKYIVFVLAVVAFTGCRGVLVTSCSTNPTDDVIKITSLNIDPSPIQVPGSVSVSLAVDITKSIDRNVRVDVIMTKRTFWWFWGSVPCFNNIGSCTYMDACSFLGNLTTNDCHGILRERNITCSCPVAAGTYTLPHHSFYIDSNTFGVSIPTLIGEYRANVRLTDSNTQTEIACFDVEAELTDPPSPS